MAWNRAHREHRSQVLADSALALAELIELPNRVARRLDDDPVTLSQLTAAINQARHRLAQTSDWLHAHHSGLARNLDAVVEVAEGDVRPGLQAAWSPGRIPLAPATSVLHLAASWEALSRTRPGRLWPAHVWKNHLLRRSLHDARLDQDRRQLPQASTTTPAPAAIQNATSTP